MSIDWFSRDLTATTGGDQLAVAFVYSKRDPYAVTLRLGVKPTVWVLEREQLRIALMCANRPHGDGDLCITNLGEITCVAIDNVNGHLVVELVTAELRDAMQASRRVVEYGHETVDWDWWLLDVTGAAAGGEVE